MRYPVTVYRRDNRNGSTFTHRGYGRAPDPDSYILERNLAAFQSPEILLLSNTLRILTGKACSQQTGAGTPTVCCDDRVPRMRFLWPDLLWLLLALPVLVAAYLYVLWRKKKSAVQYASLQLVRDAIGPGQRFRRHLPPLVFLLALAAALVALARPSAVFVLPSQNQTIILAMDVSRSMRANDVDPNRI